MALTIPSRLFVGREAHLPVESPRVLERRRLVVGIRKSRVGAVGEEIPHFVQFHVFDRHPQRRVLVRPERVNVRAGRGELSRSCVVAGQDRFE